MKDIIGYKFQVELEQYGDGYRWYKTVKAQTFAEAKEVALEREYSDTKVIDVIKIADSGYYIEMSEETRSRIEAEKADSIPF